MSNTSTIISLTPKAITYIKKMISREGEQKIFRLSVKTSGCSGFSYVPAIVNEPQPTDIPLQQEGLTIYIDAKSANYLRGTLLDLVEKELGQQHWSFTNPNVAAMCGCGESFSIKSDNEE